MFFGGDDEEQDFASAGGGSKLSSLFTLNQQTNTGGNSNLTYTAPKQPKKKGAPQEGQGAAQQAQAVLVAAVVHAYKYVDGRYTSQGKLGSALLGNPTTKDYRILLYISKDKQVTNAKITPSMVFTLQANNYASFYDDGRTSWSVMFETEENAIKFTKQVGLAKAHCGGPSSDTVVSQDLVLGEGKAVETGDAVEVRYTGWLLHNGSYGQMFDSNANSDKLFRLKLGKGKVIKGWDTGLVGIKKGGKRMLVIPPSLGYGAQAMGDKIPANSTLIFETELIRAKFQRGEQPSPAPPAVSPAPPSVNQPTGMDDLPDIDDQTVKGRTRSITEHMTQPSDSGKSKLISRMAKMGKPMLPMAGATPATGSDDEDAELEEHYQPELDEQPSVIQRPEAQMPSRVQPTPPFQQPQMFTQQPAVQSHTPVGFQQYNNSSQGQGGNPMSAYHQSPNFLQHQQLQQQQIQQQQLQQLQQQQLQQQQLQQQQLQQQQLQSPAFQSSGFQMGSSGMLTQNPYSSASSTPPASNQSVDVFGPVLLTETRQQNTEVRMAISKIGDKVDKVYERMTELQSSSGSSVSLGVTAPNMEVSILIQNVTRIAQENEHLKKDIFDKSAKIEGQNEKIAELLHKNQQFVEQSNTLLEERNEGYKHTASQSQAKVLELEQQKVTLASDLSAASAQLSAIQLELATSRKNEAELMQRMQSTKDTSYQSAEERERLRLQHEEDEKKMSELTSSLREEKQHRKNVESSHSQLQEEFADLKQSKESLDRSIADRRRKTTTERKKLEDEMEEMKSNLEQEIQTLHDKLRRQKTSADESTSDKMSRIELEIEEQWQKKSEKLLTAANEKHSRALGDLKEEIDDLKFKLKDSENKIQSLRSSNTSNDEKINELEDEIEELTVWKEKYDNLRGQATAMKEKYEERIQELEEENDSQSEKVEELEEQVEELEEKIKTTPVAVGPAAAVSGDLVGEVKKIMNNVYKDLRDEFEPNESYKGTEVLSSLLGSIKSTTLQLVNSQKQKESAEVVDEDSEEEEEEEETKPEEKSSSGQISNKSTEASKTETVKEETKSPAPATPVVEESIVADDVIVVESAAITTASPNRTPVTPAKITSKTGYQTGDKGNRIYSEKLDQSKKKPVSSGIKEEHGHVTGDKGNRIYSEKLDQLDTSKSSESPVKETINKSESSSVHSQPSPQPDKTQPVVEETIGKSESSTVAASPPSPDKKPVVEESIGKSESSTVEAGLPTSDRKPVKPTKITSKTDCKTGDKGNRIYSEKLDESKPAKPAAAKPVAAAVKPVAVKPSVMVQKTGHVTGDKGNKYHTEYLDHLKPVSETFGKSESSTSQAAPPISKQKIEETIKPATVHQVESSPPKSKQKTEEAIKPATAHQVQAPKPKPVIPKMTSKTAHITGDKGNRLYTDKLDKSHPLASRKEVKVSSLEKDSDNIVGDKGNPYHTEALDKSDKDKTVDDKNKDQHSNKNTVETSKDSKSTNSSSKDDQTKSPSQPSAKNNDKESKSRTSSVNSTGQKSRTSSSGSLDNVPTLATKEPPPLVDEEEDSPLFGNDSTVADTLGINIKANETTEKDKNKKPARKTSNTKLPSKSDLIDEDDKQPPPPLFGDDDDEDDLDWLS